MKSFLLAAVAVIAVPAIAQDQTAPMQQQQPPAGEAAPTTDQTTPPADSAAPPAGDTMTTPPADPAAPAPAPADPAAPAPAPAGDPAMQAPPAPAGDPAMAPSQGAAPMAAPGGDPVGGYQPSGPALQGTAAPGATVRFQPAQSPDQAYPAPAPLADYPVCKKGQFDKCKNRGGK